MTGGVQPIGGRPLQASCFVQAEKKKYQAEAAERARRKAEQAKQALEAFQRMNNVQADPNAQVGYCLASECRWTLPMLLSVPFLPTQKCRVCPVGCMLISLCA